MRVEALTGNALDAALDAVARLRIEVFSAFPYLYDGDLAYARTMAVNGLVMGQIFYLINTRFFTAPSWTVEGITGNRVVLIAIGVCIALQLLFTYAPFMNILFETTPLDAASWAQCIAVGIVVFVLVEAEKALARAGKHPFARDFSQQA